ncbi:MAG: DNA-binding response regulator [Polaromonas sp.]|nr:DNA-binding response regulator [Polaromonas sp.]
MSIFVVDGHPLMRDALGMLIRRLSNAVTIVEFDNPADALLAEEASGIPELITLELQSQGTHGLSRLTAFREQWPDTPLVVVTAATGQGLETLALESGASAFIHKSANGASIGSVLRGFLSDEAEGDEPAPTEKLSKRQKQLLNLLDKGMSNRDIADSLQISEHTVKVHLWRLFRRLNVKSRSQASHLARTQGLL